MKGLEKFDLRGKVAVITGGAGLLGKEHAIALARSGANVAITDVDGEAAQEASRQLARDHGIKTCIGLRMDVTDTDSVRSVRDELLVRYKAVNILVNNAAVDPKVKQESGVAESSRFENFPLDQWNYQIDVGLCCLGHRDRKVDALVEEHFDVSGRPLGRRAGNKPSGCTGIRSANRKGLNGIYRCRGKTTQGDRM